MKKFKTDKPDLRLKKDSNLEFKFLWIVEFPLFTLNQERNQIESSHHPFTAPIEEDLQQLKNKQNLMDIKGKIFF